MKKEIAEIAKKGVSELAEKKITRKEALKKTGYIAASAATMMILLSSPKAHAGSPGDNDYRGSHHGSNHGSNHGRGN